MTAPFYISKRHLKEENDERRLVLRVAVCKVEVDDRFFFNVKRTG